VLGSLSSRVVVPTPQKVSGIVVQSAPLVPSRMTRRRIAQGEPQEPGESLLAMAGVPPLPGSISCAPGPGRVHGDRRTLSINRRPQKDAPRSVRNRCGERFVAPFLTRRAGDERCRGSPADRAGVSNERPSGRCDAGGHWVPAQRSTSWLGAPEAGDPRGASWLAVATPRRCLQTCAARSFRDRDFDKNPKSAVEKPTGRRRPKGRGTG
jgi:hypothetical protein